MKTFKSLLSEKNESVIEEALNISKLKRLNLVDNDKFSKFVVIMRKMDADKPVTIKEKDIIMDVFDELINAVVNDQTLLNKIAKRKTGDSEDK